jgi:hypothetical protein
VAAALCAGQFAAAGRVLPRQQNPESMAPDASATKAKAILRQLIQGLGGQAYVSVHDSDCSGRISQFGLAGDMTGFVLFRDYRILPDKNRVEYGKNGDIIDIYSGDQGWTLDKSGVGELPATSVADFQGQLKTSLNSLLRDRLSEPGMFFQYAGADVVDLKQADWVEITDSDQRTFRIAVDQFTHVPVRSIVITHNPETNEASEELTYYSEWHLQDGVQTPFQVTRERDGRRFYQAFYFSCKYNEGLSPDLFTRASLEEKKSGKNNKKK